MEYAIIFLPLIGSIIGYLGKSLNKYFDKYPMIVPNKGKNITAYSIYPFISFISSTLIDPLFL